MCLVIVLAPHIRQTWSYLKVNKIRPTNKLKAKYLWGCPGFSSSLLFNVPVGLNEVIDRRPLLVEVHSSCSVSILSHPAEICIVDCHTAPHISQKEASSLNKCKNLFLLLWVVGKGDYAEVPHVMLAQDKRTWVMYSGWSTLTLHYQVSLSLATFTLYPRLVIYFCVISHSRGNNEPPGVFHVCTKCTWLLTHVWGLWHIMSKE